MKNFRRIVVLAFAVVLAASSMSAGLRFGVKAGVAVNNLKFNKDLLDSDNRAGFTGGVMTELTLPIVGLGFDASLMYTHRNADPGVTVADQTGTVSGDAMNMSRDYIEIPINLKYKFGLPIAGNVISPFIMTGPSFAFLVSDKKINEFFENKTCDIAWNFGFGVELFSHLQVSASYGLGITKAVENIKAGSSIPENLKNIDAKNRFWTVTAAYLF